MLTSKFHELWRRFLGAEHGNVAVIFGIALVPLICFVGAAIDFSEANWAKAQLDAAADAAAISAVNQAALALSTSETKQNAINLFETDGSVVTRAKIKKVSVKVTDAKGVRTAVVNYSAQMPTWFMGIAGFNDLPLAGTATASSGSPAYVDFYLLLDNTPSMGVGATTTDIDTMVSNTPDQCAFACHDLSKSPNDYYGLAKKLGVQMRIDVLRQATQQLMDTAVADELRPRQFRMAIYTFGTSASNLALTTVQPLTSDLSLAKSSASAIDLMTVPYQNYAGDTDTNTYSVLSSINGNIPSPGDGSSASSPLKYLFFVSDGVTDRALGSPGCSQPTVISGDSVTGKNYTRCQEPLDPSWCQSMKNRGIKIAVLYTTYLPLPTNAWYNQWVAPYSDTIASDMQACASPGFYFEVSPTQGISQAMTALFQKAVQEARLTR